MNITHIFSLGSNKSVKGLHFIRSGEAYIVAFSGFVGHMAHLLPGQYFGEHSLHRIGKHICLCC